MGLARILERLRSDKAFAQVGAGAARWTKS
jgi:hypothetical protein